MIEDHEEDLQQRATDDQPRVRPRLATALAVLTVLALVGGLALFFWLEDRTADRVAAEEDRAEVIEAAERFTEVWNTFRPSDAETYVERVSPLLSTKFRTEFETAAGDVVTGITQQRLFSKGFVLRDGDGVPLIGVASMDDDSAQVLVVADAKRVANQQRVLRHWRWEVSLIKVDGQWLVDKFVEV